MSTRTRSALVPAAAALGLGLGAVGGGVLTLGLVQRWGEVFPRRMVGLRGRRVPVLPAVLPGGFIALLVTAAADRGGGMLVR